MTSPLVVDAGIAVKRVLEEDGSAAARRLIGGATLVAPDVILTECADVIWKRVRRGDLAAGFAPARLRALRRAPVRLTPAPDLLDRALDVAVELAHPVYDRCYVALALEPGGALVTDDARLIRSTGARTELTGRVRPLADRA